ncbi:curli production assembly protein CsgE [Salinicola endophyticus]|uniref:Curli production assembly/transport component CsgE n=1 Tax=Salinicola endophyticus TaxID=1949083 RepID=A0ABY8FCA7_9GAMM|nr:CsgE family curli-type amyloid fiber assembly protein [Salinicola endophyticus]WFF40297.1 curli production assembly protein CsgE [Salinicola endophyticus]
MNAYRHAPGARLLGLLVLLALSTDGLAQDGVESDAAKAPDTPTVNIDEKNPQRALDKQFNLQRPELSGVIIDRTLTMAGRTFYRSFSQAAMRDPIVASAELTVTERPDPRWGSQLWISERNQTYFSTQLSPRISEADRYADDAVRVVQEAILRRRIAQSLQPSLDLSDEEL